MSENCGECIKPYSTKCYNLKKCRIHNADCFSCRKCTIGKELHQCLMCQRRCQKDESFYHAACEAYFCINQFQFKANRSAQVKLPCGCFELRQHIEAFIKGFCSICKRRISTKNKIKQPTQCSICRNKRQKKSKPAQESYNYSSEDESDQQSDDQDEQSQSQGYSSDDSSSQSETPEDSESEYQPESKSLMSDSQSKLKKQTRKLWKKKEEVQSIRDKLKQMQQSKIKYGISEFTRMQFKQILFKEKDDNCLICLEGFSLARKPMMICLQQHLLCEFCFKQVKILKKCPLCREDIIHSRVSVHRERLKLLELQKFYLEHMDDDNQRLQTFNKKNKKVALKSKKNAFSQTKSFPKNSLKTLTNWLHATNKNFREKY